MLTIENIAAMVNAANIALAGDANHTLWVDKSNWVKDGLINRVDFVLADPATTPAETHANWLAHKESNGWRYGIMCNEVTKEHPLMMPFDELDDENQLQNAVFIAIVNALSPFLAPTAGESTTEP